ncbi:hypothetical protein [Teichococcus aestuarii]|uniref:Uncharacterized protein n=1 Tax=Teichococcus aestuarii TaxID=568898 RepID=A0A2U1V946_9PROT|nr:hypothetical protein [Pseudoroseomonas aestuarii]PWC30396.1 hypothetical protein CR165_00300 [Pseudoroseomonas aestuarii]
MFEVREEKDGNFSVWIAGQERLAMLKTEAAAVALMEAFEDSWDEAFMQAVASVQEDYAADFIDPLPPASN